MPASYTISAVDKVYRTYQGTFTDKTGAPVTPASVDVVLIPHATELVSGLSWTTVTLTAGKLQLLYAGPLADPTSAMPVLATGSDVYARVTDTPEVQATLIDTILIAHTPWIA